MKTRILSLIAMIVIMSLSATTTYANIIVKDAFTVLNDISAINKIEVHGNVELYISDATHDQVKVYNKYYAESALVKSKDGVLSIASYTTEKLVVWVSAADLRSVSAFDNSTVKSFGKLSKIEFNVDLHNNATAVLNLDNYSTTLTVKDAAMAELKGNTEVLNLDRKNQSNIKSSDFAVAHLIDSRPVVTAQMGNKMTGM